MAIELPPLPWAPDALAPQGISKETIEFHYGKHHQAYVTKTNELIANTANASKSLEEIVKSSQGPLFNNAAQVWNHTFYWNSLSPKGGGQPTGAIANAIKESFGGYDQFRKEFTEAGISQFGSGWAWLVKDGGKLKIVKTPNAETPLTTAAKPIITADVWEHAYYIDFRNARPKYLDTFMDKLINWDFANKNFA